MCDDHVLAGSSRPLQHVERRHHRGGDAANRGLRVAALEGVDGLFAPVDPQLGQFALYALNDLLCGQRTLAEKALSSNPPGG